MLIGCIQINEGRVRTDAEECSALSPLPPRFLSLLPALLSGGICPIFSGLAHHCESSGRMERCRKKKGARIKEKQLLPLNWCSSYRDMIQDMFSDSAIKKLLGNNYILSFICVCMWDRVLLWIWKNLFCLYQKDILSHQNNKKIKLRWKKKILRGPLRRRHKSQILGLWICQKYSLLLIKL